MTDTSTTTSTTTSAVSPRLGYMIGRLNKLVRRELEDALAEADLSLAQYTAMAVLASRPGLSNAQLARRSLITPQATHQALSLLAERELVERSPHPTKGRILCMNVTPKGEQLLVSLEQTVDRVEDQLMAGLDPIEREQLIDSLATIAGLGSAKSIVDIDL